MLGGTGNTGRRVVRQALSRGFAVHALARSRDRLEAWSERLQVVEGTPQSEADMRRAMLGCIAMLSALGISRTSAWPWAPLTSPPEFMQTCMGNATRLMREQGISRIVVISAGGVGDSAGDLPPGFAWLVRHSGIGAAYRGHEDSERVLRQSGLDWTALRPSALRDREHAGEVVLSYHGQPKPRPWISREALAGLMLDALDDDSLIGRAPTVSQR